MCGALTGIVENIFRRTGAKCLNPSEGTPAGESSAEPEWPLRLGRLHGEESDNALYFLRGSPREVLVQVWVISGSILDSLIPTRSNIRVVSWNLMEVFPR